jgi:hypothetical protein
MLGKYQVAAEFVASRVVLSSTELVSALNVCNVCYLSVVSYCCTTATG